MWWSNEKHDYKSIAYNTRRSPVKPRHMRSAISRLRASVHCVLLCSLLTTLAWKASRCRRFIGTSTALVCSYPRTDGHAAIRLREQSRRSSNAMRILANCKAKFAKSKVPSFLFLCFRDLRNFHFADLAFFDFSIRLPRPAWRGRGWGRLEKMFRSRWDSLPLMVRQPRT
jgi:hypothetical protein